jgi:hypothetical protein
VSSVVRAQVSTGAEKWDSQVEGMAGGADSRERERWNVSEKTSLSNATTCSMRRSLSGSVAVRESLTSSSSVVEPTSGESCKNVGGEG